MDELVHLVIEILGGPSQQAHWDDDCAEATRHNLLLGRDGPHASSLETFKITARWTTCVQFTTTEDHHSHRTTKFIPSRQMLPLTTLVGERFVRSWLGAVKGHALLWKHGAQFTDPGPLSVAYDPEEECGVLTDCDLPISMMSARSRKGTVPFTALELLDAQYWDGEMQRLYHHELEAFIWILPFVFLRYQDAKPQMEKLVVQWMTGDYNLCRMEKTDFASGKRLAKAGRLVQTDFQSEWTLASNLVGWIVISYQTRDFAASRSRKPIGNPEMSDIWREFVELLRLTGEEIPAELGYVNQLVDELDLEKVFAAVDDDGMSGIVAGPSD